MKESAKKEEKEAEKSAKTEPARPTSDRPTLSTEPYRGVRDFFPADMAIEKKIFEVWREACEKFGYEEYGASVLEPAELYRAKSGEEIVNEQTYTFTDRGEREVTLRPEMTPTVARMVSARRRELVFPLRWYSIPNLFRYENPQRGRLREHWQLNVDMFGVDSIEADVEIISLAYSIMKKFGAKEGDFEIRINNRLSMPVKANYFELSNEQSEKLTKLVDKRQKISKDEFTKQVKQIFNHDHKSEVFLLALDKKDVSSYFDWIAKNSLNPDKNPFPGIEKDTIKKVITNLNTQGITNILFDPELSRGFDYYTGIIFEIFDTNPANRRSLFGGGRYDNLTELFGGEKIPAVGFGMGDVTMRDFLETHDLLKNLKIPAVADYAICVMSSAPDQIAFAMKIAEQLRLGGNGGNEKNAEKGSRVSIDFTYKKIGDQIKNADKRGIPNVIIVGENEAKTGTYKIKNLKTGAEKNGETRNG